MLVIIAGSAGDTAVVLSSESFSAFIDADSEVEEESVLAFGAGGFVLAAKAVGRALAADGGDDGGVHVGTGGAGGVAEVGGDPEERSLAEGAGLRASSAFIAVSNIAFDADRSEGDFTGGALNNALVLIL